MKKLGFTLIELLIAISIIAIITTFGVTSFLTAQKQTRDARRQSLVLQIQSTFEQYFVEHSAYPNEDDATIDASFEDGVRPLDPKNSGDYTLIWDYTGPDEYCVCATLETQLGNANAPSGTACDWNNSSGDHFCVQNKQ